MFILPPNLKICCLLICALFDFVPFGLSVSLFGGQVILSTNAYLATIWLESGDKAIKTATPIYRSHQMRRSFYLNCNQRREDDEGVEVFTLEVEGVGNCEQSNQKLVAPRKPIFREILFP